MPRPTARAGRSPSTLLPVLALTLNALVWGTSWWPFRRLQAEGLHPLWATSLIFALAAAVIVALRPRALAQVWRTPALWVLVLGAGATNAAFNWAVVIGDVVRVVLLFYLMPLWTVLLARALLGERLGARAGLRVALGLAGAATVLWPSNASGLGALPIPRALADWLGLVGGFSFALNNVMLRREAARPEEGRALAMFLGGALVAGALAALLCLRDPALRPPAPAPGWIWLVLALVAVFLGGNLSLQYGAARLPANRTAVVMLTEVLFASASAVLLGGEVFSAPLLIGGGLIVLAAALAAIEPTADASP
ncbi:MAG TPA: DMT family transporter [Caldimonas sp.]